MLQMGEQEDVAKIVSWETKTRGNHFWPKLARSAERNAAKELNTVMIFHKNFRYGTWGACQQ